MAAVVKSANAALPSLKRPTEGVERLEEGAVVLLLEGIGSRHDDDGARARGSPRWQRRLGAPPWLGEGEREGQGASEGECWLRGALEDLAPDGWDHGRRTVTTAHPRVVPDLRPVGHRGSENSERRSTLVTDRGTLAPNIS
jgi:hypothetical protein